MVCSVRPGPAPEKPYEDPRGTVYFTIGGAGNPEMPQPPRSKCSAWDAGCTSISWSPWAVCVADEAHMCFVRWFVGGTTNASFNEIDRHVLRCPLGGHDHLTAFVSDGGDGTCRTTSLREV